MPRRAGKGKNLLHEWKCNAHERELYRELTRLDERFAAWRRGEISSGELAVRVHEFDAGPGRELFKRYNEGDQGLNVAYAIVAGILDEREVPPELLKELASQITFFKELKERGELRLPGES